jgi:hypothetical protein
MEIVARLLAHSILIWETDLPVFRVIKIIIGKIVLSLRMGNKLIILREKVNKQKGKIKKA